MSIVPHITVNQSLTLDDRTADNAHVNEGTSEPIRVTLTTCPNELSEIGRLRYEVTVLEMGLCMRHANHYDRTVIEPLDAWGHVFAVWQGRQLLGSLRVNFLKEGDIGHYFDAYGISKLADVHKEHISITTRLVVRKEFRGSRVSLMLAKAAFIHMLDHGITHDVIDSRPHLVTFFQRLGYTGHVESFHHPEFGEVRVQCLSLRDSCHLRRVKSPLLSCLERHEGRQSEE
jgi:predicted GNAT family N-acyltransferase